MKKQTALLSVSLLMTGVAAANPVMPRAGQPCVPAPVAAAVVTTGTDVSGNVGNTPPMGWNSYNRFGLGVTAQLVKEIADGIKRYKLDEAGYKYIVMDDGWQGKQLGPGGELLCAPDRFPEGIPPLVKYVKGLGLELGIYSSPNKLSCGGQPLESVHDPKTGILRVSFPDTGGNSRLVFNTSNDLKKWTE